MNKVYKIFIPLVFLVVSSFAQNNTIPNSWHMMDKETDGYYGISADKAYQFLKTNKLKSKTVIVAVIDTGIDTLHEDLKEVIWVNPKEIPNNRKDDDNNGYIDDVHGWNFLGGRDGRNVKVDSDERGRVYYGLKNKWDNKEIDKTTLSKSDLYEYNMFLRAKFFFNLPRAKAEIKGNETEEDQFANMDIPALKSLHNSLISSDSILKIAIGKDTFTGNELNGYVTKSFTEKRGKNEILGLMKENNMLDQTVKEFIDGLNDYIEYIEGEQRKVEAKNKIPEPYRKNIVGDDETNLKLD